MEQIRLHVPCLLDLLTLFTNLNTTSLASTPDISLVQCPQELCEFLKALLASSPVCALVQPSCKLLVVLERMKTTSISIDVASLETLQQEIPILFTLLENLTYYPKGLLAPILSRLIQVAEAPFANPDPSTESSCCSAGKETLSFFPQMHPLRSRKDY